MAEVGAPVDLSFLSEADADALQRVLGAVQRGLGEKVCSVLLVGPMVPPVRYEGARPLELLVVVTDLPVPALSNLAHQTRDLLSEGLRLRLLTQREVLRSADVFTLELAEVQARHVLLAGEDPFRELHFTGGELRRSVEQTLRGVARELRQGVLAAVSGDRGREAAQLLVRTCFDRLAVLAHHTLALMGDAVPESEEELLRGLAERASVDPAPFVGWMRQVRAGASPADPVAALADLLALAEAAVRLVDRMGASD